LESLDIRAGSEGRDLNFRVGPDLSIRDRRRVIEARMGGLAERHDDECRHDQGAQRGDDAADTRTGSGMPHPGGRSRRHAESCPSVIS
jgi:hypothetical protein